DERMRDHLADRRGGGSTMFEEGEFRLGAIARAMVTGSRAGLTDVEQRTLSENVAANGGYLISDQELAADVIDRLRNKAQVINAGARTVVLPDAQEYAYARMTGGSTASWKLEGDPVTASDQSFDRVVLKPHTAIVMQK